MTSHLFGAVLGMGRANVGLKGIADNYKYNHRKDAADFIRDCYYVDVGLCSVENEKLAYQKICLSLQGRRN